MTREVSASAMLNHLKQADTGVRALTHGRFPMSPGGLATMSD